MRYADGGGLTVEGRSRRERVRLQAAEMFEHDVDARQVAQALRVSPQVPAHRAFERDEDAIAEWRSATWAKVRG